MTYINDIINSLFQIFQVLTGMSRSERVAAYQAIRTLNGRVQKEVNRKTTHVLLGSCREDSPPASPGRDLNSSGINRNHNGTRNSGLCKATSIDKSLDDKNGNKQNDCINKETELDTEQRNMASIESLARKLNVSSPPAAVRKSNTTMTPKSMRMTNKMPIEAEAKMASIALNMRRTNIASPQTEALAGKSIMASTEASAVKTKMASNKTAACESNMASAVVAVGKSKMAPLEASVTESNMAAEAPAARNKMAPRKERTLNALLGAARGCRVLFRGWALACLEEGRWVHHCGYEVPHLRKLSQVECPLFNSPGFTLTSS